MWKKPKQVTTKNQWNIKEGAQREKEEQKNYKTYKKQLKYSNSVTISN